MSGLLAYFQYQALFLWLVLAAGWTLSAVNRRRERLRRLGHHKVHRCGGGGGSCGGGGGVYFAPNSAGRIEKGSGSRSGYTLANRSPDGAIAVAGDDARHLTTSPICGVVASGNGYGGGATGANGDADMGGAVRRAAASQARLRCGSYTHPSPAVLPPVCAVMPVKGCRPHSLNNWKSLLDLQYGADLEFVFVVESREDAAVSALEELLNQTGCEAPGAPGRKTGVKMRVVVAGLAQSCSQKAHNLCAGIESCDPRVAREQGYILCLDDDVALHPGSLRDLVEDLQRRPDVFMATGYPYDVPPPGSSFAAYLALAYHLPLLIAFSIAPDTAFVWGGCMLLRADRLLPGDPGGLLRAWRNGGYSDDLILASYCTERRLGIRVPPFAIFPQRLDASMTWAAWLNYLHRQLFVLDTYTNEHNRKTNHTMMWLHSILSWLLVLPSLAVLQGARRACNSRRRRPPWTRCRHGATTAVATAAGGGGRGGGGLGGGALRTRLHDSRDLGLVPGAVPQPCRTTRTPLVVSLGSPVGGNDAVQCRTAGSHDVHLLCPHGCLGRGGVSETRGESHPDLPAIGVGVEGGREGAGIIPHHPPSSPPHHKFGSKSADCGSGHNKRALAHVFLGCVGCLGFDDRGVSPLLIILTRMLMCVCVCVARVCVCVCVCVSRVCVCVCGEKK
ncbi:hypothetical protein Vretimale_6482 [Volvox reticuliferus]|uniref:ceramide glucosyltransferase n=1 Tax=Volvox reticuliferus TaxID=1737510 RepID=A0A8J4G7L7_9CHLO|nr:hypothetical protein Vretimale_6482 [Volvox reticuliferus]